MSGFARLIAEADASNEYGWLMFIAQLHGETSDTEDGSGRGGWYSAALILFPDAGGPAWHTSHGALSDDALRVGTDGTLEVGITLEPFGPASLRLETYGPVWPYIGLWQGLIYRSGDDRHRWDQVLDTFGGREAVVTGGSAGPYSLTGYFPDGSWWWTLVASTGIGTVQVDRDTSQPGAETSALSIEGLQRTGAPGARWVRRTPA